MRNAWYVAAWPEELGRSLLARRIAGEHLVFFRQEDGTPVCLQDRCPHRFAPPSMGTLLGDRIKCRYHGLQYEPVLFNVDADAVKVRRVMERLIAVEGR